MEPPITVVDVGARWGVAERWSTLAPDLKVYGFDPDLAECERLNAALTAAGDSTTTYVAYALGSTQSEATLHVTTEPACSSLYPPIAHLARTFKELECIEPADQISVHLITLDAWCAEHEVDAVDFIKLDTQGSELGVLQGAEKTLDTVLVLEIEVEFNPIYEGQPLFGDVDHFLRARGFSLWRLDSLTHYSTGASGAVAMQGVSYFDSVPHRVVNGGGQLFWGHAYYARNELCPGSNLMPTNEQRRRGSAVAEAAGLADLATALRS